MTAATTTLPATPAIVVEDDPTPFVLRTAHRLRLATADPAARQILDRLGAADVSVAVTVEGTPRKATVALTRDTVTVRHGLAADHHLLLTLGDQPGEPVLSHQQSDSGNQTLLVDALAILNPPVGSWPARAQRFWDLTGRDAAMPGSVKITAADGEVCILGDSAPRYEITGEAAVLARTFAGLDSFFDHILGGALQVRGTMAQLSVMIAAFWKVQTHA